MRLIIGTQISGGHCAVPDQVLAHRTHKQDKACRRCLTGPIWSTLPCAVLKHGLWT